MLGVRPELVGKDVAALFKVGVEGEYGGDNCQVHEDGKQPVRADTKNGDYQRRQPEPEVNLGYTCGSGKLHGTTAAFPEIGAYAGKYGNSSGKRQHRVGIGIEGHQVVCPGKQSGHYS